jgi:hypothetical protein
MNSGVPVDVRRRELKGSSTPLHAMTVSMHEPRIHDPAHPR